MTFLRYRGRGCAVLKAGTYSAADRTGKHGLGQRGTRSFGATRRADHLERQAAVAPIIDFMRLLERNGGGGTCEASDEAQQNQPPAPRPTAVL